MKKSIFRQDVQGLRGIAVLSVVLFHAWGRLIPGGFVGVDIFFVISGFVITQSILRDYALGEFSVAAFYRRRVRRIFPALYTMIGAALVAGWFLLAPYDYMELAKSAFATVFFASNIFFKNLSGYFDGSASLKPLLHTWSLSVEEQFYVAYPLFVVFTHRLFPRFLRPAITVLAIVSLALSVWMLHRHDATSAFYLAPPRAFELLMGASIALPGLRARVPRWLRDSLSLAGLAMLAFAFAAYSAQTVFPGLAAALPCLGAALIIRAGTGEDEPVTTIAGRLLSFRPLTWFGDLSYSLYLWHWPILVLARRYVGGELGMRWILGCVSAAVLAAVLSMRWIEKPVLDKRQAKRPYLGIGASMMTVSALLLLAVVHAKGVPQRYSPSSRVLFAAIDDYNHERKSCHTFDSTPIPYDRNCDFGAPHSTPDVAVWGDSHGAELVVAVGERLAPEGRSAMEITASSCPPSMGFTPKDRPYCAGHNAETLRRLNTDPRIRMVVLTANFSSYAGDGFPAFLEGYRRVFASLRASGKSVVIVYPIPIQDFDPPSLLGMRNQAGQGLDGVGMPRPAFQKTNQPAIDFLDSFFAPGDTGDKVTRVIPEDLLCDATVCKVFQKNVGVLYFNNAHLSVTGARVLAEKMAL